MTRNGTVTQGTTVGPAQFLSCSRAWRSVLAGPRSGGKEEFSQPVNLAGRESAINLAADLMSRTATPPSPPDVGAVAETACPERRPYRSPSIETPAELDEARLRNRGRCSRAEPKYAALWHGEQVPPRAGRKDDQVVRIAFIDDLASLARFHMSRSDPGPGGRLSASLQQISVMEWG